MINGTYVLAKVKLAMVKECEKYLDGHSYADNEGIRYLLYIVKAEAEAEIEEYDKRMKFVESLPFGPDCVDADDAEADEEDED